MNNPSIKILLVQNSPNDFKQIRAAFAAMQDADMDIDSTCDYGWARKKWASNHYDICFLGDGAGGRSGIVALSEFCQDKTEPVVLVTCTKKNDFVCEVFEKGAADVVCDDEITPRMLARCIWYVMRSGDRLRRLKVSRQRLRLLSRKLLYAQEKERSRISLELHDSVSGNLSAIKLALEDMIQKSGPEVSDQRDISLEEVLEVVQSTMDETARISANLSPAILEERGLAEAIALECRRFQALIPGVRIEHQLDVSEENISDDLKLAVYRIVQEALNNAAKYSNASRVNVICRETFARMELSISDDGTGFNKEDATEVCSDGTGLGLDGMRDRAELFEGSFEIDTEPGKGTRITSFWPINR